MEEKDLLSRRLGEAIPKIIIEQEREKRQERRNWI